MHSGCDIVHIDPIEISWINSKVVPNRIHPESGSPVLGCWRGWPYLHCCRYFHYHLTQSSRGEWHHCLTRAGHRHHKLPLGADTLGDLTVRAP